MYSEGGSSHNDDSSHYIYGNRHWMNFQSIRKKHNENICRETNKLLLRLDKLINDAPPTHHDGGEQGKLQMREHEKSIVDWTSDDVVKLCPFCAKSFNLSRRRHHCRLCGAVVCHGCSLFLDYEAACKLIRPANLQERQDGNSVAIPPNNDNQLSKIRLCEDCKLLLDKRMKSIEDHYYHPFFCDFYEKLRSEMTVAEELLETYDNICESLKIGEEEYKIQDAQELRSKIDKLKENIAYMAKNITTLSAASNEKETQLLTAIRQSIGFWVKKNELLSTYPSEEEYEKLKLERRQQLEAQLSMNKSTVIHGHEGTINLGESSLLRGLRIAGGSQNNHEDSPQTNNKSVLRGQRLNRFGVMKRSATMGDGFGSANSAWMPDQSNVASPVDTEEVNPLLMQIRNIEEYIKQARNASRYEEVATLEANKRDLEIEFLIQQGDSMQLEETSSPTEEKKKPVKWWDLDD